MSGETPAAGRTRRFWQSPATRAVAVLALLAAIVAVVMPGLRPDQSEARFTSSTSLTGAAVTAAACASTTTWTSLLGSTATGSREAWNRLASASSTSDAWNGTTWSVSSVTATTDSALYCDSNQASLLNNAGDSTRSSSRSYATWGVNGDSTLAIWFKGTSTASGRLVSLTEGTSGSSTYTERALWMNADGTLSFGARTSTTASWTISTPQAWNDGAWHLAVVTMPSAAGAGGATVHVDGVERVSVNGASSLYSRARGSSGSNAAWSIGDNNAGRAPTGCPTTGWIGTYDEFVQVSGLMSATLLGTGAGSLMAAQDS